MENPEFLKRHLELWYQQPDAYERRFCQLIGGRAPQAADEIAMDERSLELLGITPEEGQTITLQLKMGYDRPVIERQFTLVGWFGYSDIMNTGFGIVSEAYLTEYADELAEASEQTGSQVGLDHRPIVAHLQLQRDGLPLLRGDSQQLQTALVHGNFIRCLGCTTTDQLAEPALVGIRLLIPQLQMTL